MSEPRIPKTGPLQMMSFEETIYLIDKYHGYECLWDIRIPDYRNKEKKASCIMAIRLALDSQHGIKCTDDNINAKLESLKTAYTRQLRLMYDSKRSGAGSDDMYKPQWQYFTRLNFLRPIIKIIGSTSSNLKMESTNGLSPTGASTTNYPLTTQRQQPTIVFNADSDDLDFLIIEDEGAKDFNHCDDGEGEEAAVHKRESSVPVTTRKPQRLRKRDSKPMFRQKIASYVEEKEANKRRREEMEENPELHWCIGLAQSIREIKNEKRRRLLKADISDLVSKYTREDVIADF